MSLSTISGCNSLHAWLQALLELRGEALDAGAVDAAVSEAAELVSDSDLTVTAQTLQLATAVLRHQPAAGATVAKKARLANKTELLASARARESGL